MSMAAATIPPAPVERVIDALQAAGKRVHRSGDHQWHAQCPAHEDREPSLSVGASPSGKALLNCHAGCRPADVARALGLAMQDLFPDDQPGTNGTSSEHRQTFTYLDETGKVLFRVLKFRKPDGTKTFRAQAPGGSFSVRGLRQPLYNLPHVLAAIRDGRPVILCEGEKDAESAQWLYRDAGGIGTTKPFGAIRQASEWRPEWTETLRGAHVIVFADDDVPGRLHADLVTRLLDGTAASVRTVLPAEGCKDLAEHYAAGKGPDEARILRDDTPAPVDDNDQDTYLRAQLVDWGEFWSEDHSQVNWLAEPVIPGGGRAIALYAPAKSGKSLVILSIVAAVATGRAILGARNTRGPVSVLYIDYEMTTADVQDRLSDMGYGPESNLVNFHYALLPALPPLDTKEGAEAVCRLAELVDAQLVVIDTMGRAVQGDENDSDTVRAFYRHTGLALKQAGRSYIRTDHAGKDLTKGQRGSSAKNDDVDLVWQLTPMEGAVRLTRTHSRMSWVPETVTLHRVDDPLGWEIRGADAWPEGTVDLANRMDLAGVPLDVSYRKARDHGIKGRNDLIRAAIRYRQRAATEALIDLIAHDEEGEKVRPESAGRTSERTPGRTDGAQSDGTHPDQDKQAGAHPGAHRGAVGDADGVQPVSVDTGAPSVSPPRNPFEDD